jgi:hypothetical protein
VIILANATGACAAWVNSETLRNDPDVIRPVRAGTRMWQAMDGELVGNMTVLTRWAFMALYYQQEPAGELGEAFTRR